MSGHAKIFSDGTIRRLDLRGGQSEIVQEDDAASPKKLARILTAMLRSINDLRRRFSPRRLDFEDQTVGTAGAVLRLPHGFGGRVRWWVVDWLDAAGARPDLRKDDTNTDTTTLVLKSYQAGTATIRVEEAG